MSIFGESGFRIVKGSTYLDQVFLRMFTRYNFNQEDKVVHKSVINGFRTITSKGSVNSVDIDIIKITTDEYNYIKSLENQLVTFYPHFSDDCGDFERFIYGYIEDVKFYYRDNQFSKDAVRFTINSRDYTTDELTPIEHNLVDESNDNIVDEYDNNIIMR